MIWDVSGALFAILADLSLLSGREDGSCHFLPYPSRFVRNLSLQVISRPQRGTIGGLRGRPQPQTPGVGSSSQGCVCHCVWFITSSLGAAG